MNIRRIASIGLAAVLQVLPLTRVFVAATPATGSSYAIIATWIAGAAALLGGVDAVSGASTTITSAKTATATNGVPFSYRITTGPQTANTFAATPLPAALMVNTTSGRITGTPTVTGVYVIHLTASDSGRADRTVTADLTLTILPGGGGGAIAPAITTQPATQTVTAGANVNFSVAATGTAPLSYQWRLNGGNIANATNATLTLTSVTTAQSGGGYSCVVSNSAGTATSSTATLTVNPAGIAPTITTQPTSQTVTAGANVSFTVVASGTAPLGYQWRLNGANLGGATSATLTLSSVTTGQSGGNYSCVVSNAAGLATSAAAVLTVNAAVVAPSIITQPVAQSVMAGANVSFSVSANGTAPLSFQWRLNGVDVPGATGATLTLTNVTVGQSGGGYGCVITNVAGAVTSSVAVLTVTAAAVPPTVVTHPVNQVRIAGGTATFSVVANGTAPLSFQWRENGSDLPGATNATLTLSGVTTNQSGNNYSCVVANSAGTDISGAAVLTVNPALVVPSLTLQPVSQSVTSGATVLFLVAANGSAPLHFQWSRNGTNIAGQTSSTLTLADVTINQSGESYRCIVTNAAGSITSHVAVLTVNPPPAPPVIVGQPTSQTLPVGSPANFIVSATGPAPLHYQWYWQNAAWPGATNATLAIPAVTLDQTDRFNWCVVSNAYGVVTSQVAQLVVTPRDLPPASFQIMLLGTGRVTPNLNGQELAAGRVYTFTATPAAATRFVGWELNGAALSVSPIISLVAAGHQVLQARFEPDPMAEVAGNYEGLLLPAEGINPDLTGAVKIQVTPSGKLSGTLRQQTRRYSFRGNLNADLRAEVNVIRDGVEPLPIQLAFAAEEDAGGLQGEGWVAGQRAVLAAFRAGRGTNFVGTYTVALVEAAATGEAVPVRATANLRVTARGLGVLSGMLADGTRFAQTAPVAASGRWPLYAAGAGGRSVVYGWLDLPAFQTDAASAGVTWLQWDSASHSATEVSQHHQLAAIGSGYLPTRQPKLALAAPALFCSGALFGAPFFAPMTWDANGNLKPVASKQLTFSTAVKTGTFTGKVRVPEDQHSISFRGVLLQNRALGLGFVPGQWDRGQVWIMDQP